jgi:hypothetical protein
MNVTDKIKKSKDNKQKKHEEVRLDEAGEILRQDKYKQKVQSRSDQTLHCTDPAISVSTVLEQKLLDAALKPLNSQEANTDRKGELHAQTQIREDLCQALKEKDTVVRMYRTLDRAYSILKQKVATLQAEQQNIVFRNKCLSALLQDALADRDKALSGRTSVTAECICRGGDTFSREPRIVDNDGAIHDLNTLHTLNSEMNTGTNGLKRLDEKQTGTRSRQKDAATSNLGLPTDEEGAATAAGSSSARSSPDGQELERSASKKTAFKGGPQDPMLGSNKRTIDLEKSLEQMKAEFEAMEDYWQSKLEAERKFYETQLEETEVQFQKQEERLKEFELLFLREDEDVELELDLDGLKLTQIDEEGEEEPEDQEEGEMSDDENVAGGRLLSSSGNTSEQMLIEDKEWKAYQKKLELKDKQKEQLEILYQEILKQKDIEIEQCEMLHQEQLQQKKREFDQMEQEYQAQLEQHASAHKKEMEHLRKLHKKQLKQQLSSHTEQQQQLKKAHKEQLEQQLTLHSEQQQQMKIAHKEQLEHQFASYIEEQQKLKRVHKDQLHAQKERMKENQKQLLLAWEQQLEQLKKEHEGKLEKQKNSCDRRLEQQEKILREELEEDKFLKDYLE